MLFSGLAVFLIFIAWLAYRRSRATRIEKEIQENFWQKESVANQTRRQDISNLDYIKIPVENLPFFNSDDPILKNCETTIRDLSEKKILNLSGKTNTELKLAYGAPNLPDLTEYDENFLQLIRTLQSWGIQLCELGHTTEAIQVFEFAVSCKSDITATYTALADLYHQVGTPEKIHDLIRTASSLTSISRAKTLEKLNNKCI